jgi:hypothetical protein
VPLTGEKKAVTILPVTIPPVTIPPVTIPPVTIPSVTIPPVTIPSVPIRLLATVQAEHRKYLGAVGGIERPAGDDAGGPAVLQVALRGRRGLRGSEPAGLVTAGRVSGPFHRPCSLDRPAGPALHGPERVGATTHQAAICTRRTRSARPT